MERLNDGQLGERPTRRANRINTFFEVAEPASEHADVPVLQDLYGTPDRRIVQILLLRARINVHDAKHDPLEPIALIVGGGVGGQLRT
jgi:hypothetical protein